MFNENKFDGEGITKISGTIVKAGQSVTEDGKEIEISPQIVQQIYSDLIQRENITIGLNEFHGTEDKPGGDEVAKIMKFELSDDGSEILYKGFVHNTKKYHKKYNEGFKYVSPELDIHSEGDKIIHGQLKGAAMALNPGMIPVITRVEQMNFSAPDATQSVASGETVLSSVQYDDGWIAPFTKLETKVDEVAKSISDIGAKLNMTTNDSQTNDEGQVAQPLSADSMRDIVKDVLSEMLKGQVPPQAEETTTTSDVDVSTDGIPPELVDKFSALAARLEGLEAEKRAIEIENNKFKDDQARVQRQEYLDLLQRGRDIGIDKPEELVKSAELSEAQKIAILKSTYKVFAERNPLTKPPQASMADKSGDKPNAKDVTMESMFNDIGVNFISDEWREMAKSTGLFDNDGKMRPEYLRGYN